MGFNKEERRRRHEKGFFLKRILILIAAMIVIMFSAAIGEESDETFEKTVPFIIFGGLLPAAWAFLSIVLGLIPGTSKLERARKKRVTSRHEVCLLERGNGDTRPLEVILEEIHEHNKPMSSEEKKELWTPFKWPRRLDTIWWDEEKLEKCRKKYPEMKYDNEFGRIFLGTTWFIDGDENLEEVQEWTKDIERRGGFIRTDISGTVTHTLLTSSYDKSGYNQRATVRYNAKIVPIEDYEDLVAIAERTREHNKEMFTQSKLFDTTKSALEALEEEQGVKYVFMHENGDGVVFVYLEGGEKKSGEWNGGSFEEFWSRWGEFLTKRTIVTPRPKERCIKLLAEKLKETGIKVPHFAYIDLVFFTGATLRHEDKAVLGDVKKVTIFLGQEPPEGGVEYAEAVCSVFMSLIIDHDKDPKEYMGCYFG